eukprot:COSAG06_NODE_3899_length_4792_cov_20.315273_7_plen_61_part_00
MPLAAAEAFAKGLAEAFAKGLAEAFAKGSSAPRLICRRLLLVWLVCRVWRGAAGAAPHVP